MNHCMRCHGFLVIEDMDGEPVIRCLCCGMRAYPPIPEVPERTHCYHCSAPQAPGLMCCLVCRDKMKGYRAAHPKKKRYIGAQLPVAIDVGKL